mmetsp:Transcript_37624/g.59498  ORF Transcript_37624/g.59498 Transcript_37624/m.59498 type:complete len:112 (+) Transcript_37624:67-402(+)|eukprot:CAMPEP_0169138256 /NCGR_PEP_ID=MMETSP1015-20121227/42105_1 /TAXON_ID=342587 /ORGANISM="Karlodinium micrum, Strain CCMP2283" /LENGTH=111 /DNA_ID=CAMNT_0009203415 /DNA_START=67 /DNA_END=402 /DNA_ORIENTATION=-
MKFATLTAIVALVGAPAVGASSMRGGPVKLLAVAPAPAPAASPAAPPSPASVKTTTTAWHESGVMDKVSPTHNIDKEHGQVTTRDGKNHYEHVANQVDKHEKAVNEFGFGK